MAANNMATREVDDRVLRFLELRTEGYDTRQIGDMFGFSAGYVRSTTNRIVKDDAELHDDQISFEGKSK
jgi:hypothetical protein